jgi:hypothetical protein
MSSSTTITGDKRLDRKLNHLKGRGGNTIIRKTLRKGIQTVAASLRSAAPDATTRRAIGYRFKRNSRTGFMLSKAGIGVGKKAGKVKRHAHLKHTGTILRQTNSGASRGRVDPSRFIPNNASRAISASKPAMIAEARKELAKEARK